MYTYLIVDDEPIIRKGIRKKISPLESKISCIGEADNGEKALEIVKTLNPDFIITDMNMPVMDGLQLLPILTEKYPSKPIIVISGYKDFDYMKQAIASQAVDYILKPLDKEELQKAVLHVIDNLENQEQVQKMLISSEEETERSRLDYDKQLLKDLIRGYHIQNLSITSQTLRFTNQTHHFVMITLQSDHILDSDSIESFLAENSFGDLALYLQLNSPALLGFMILFLPVHSILPPEELCMQVIRHLNRMLIQSERKVSFGISNPHTGLSHLHEAFLETVTALNFKKMGDSSTITFYSSVSSPSASPVHWDQEGEFLFRVESGNLPETLKLLEELFSYFETLTFHTLYDIKMYCFLLSDQTRLILQTCLPQISPESANASMQNVLNGMFTLPEIREYYSQFYTNITAVLKSAAIYSENDVVKNIQIYIQRHYRQSLNMEFLSSLFYMNRSYCSHLFKEKTGVSFVDYLNHVRC